MRTYRLNDARVYLDWILLILILSFTFVAIILVPALLTVDQLASVPYALHSILSADYGVDDMALSYAQVKSDIIAEVLRDQNGMMPGDSTEKPALEPPIAMATPNLGLTETPTTYPGQPTSTPKPTDGVLDPTTTNIDPTPTNGGYPTSTQPSATDKPPNSTAVATTHPPNPTSISPTRTSAPPTTVAPTSPPPTSTRVPPTRTPAPTAPPPTNTPRPPDPTDPPDPPDPYPPPPPPPQDTPYP